ncbi:uncharacterized protein LOC121643866 isoform X1 [Melanotaenia boesemani]|uniref:uncharacterized protein LOC121643866 isoform X1 n=1 Tax=Melanotaenia boesemani TaxID=1250792 RepID=UPI001C051F73|nr:uncharacterized protein LOC121643866 isoform X1 [Melanotaenia boesemani]
MYSSLQGRYREHIISNNFTENILLKPVKMKDISQSEEGWAKRNGAKPSGPSSKFYSVPTKVPVPKREKSAQTKGQNTSSNHPMNLKQSNPVTEKKTKQHLLKADQSTSTVPDNVELDKQLCTLWKKKDTEVVVSVIPSQHRGNNFVIHHSELRSLRPHQWLTGEIIESILHHTANVLNLGSTVYVMNHYTTGVILFGNREEIQRQSLSKVNFDKYHAVVSFVNIGNVHWKFLYINAADSCVYLVDPARSSTEQQDSDLAAKRFRDYFKMRRTCHNKTDWVDLKLKGGVIQHPVQRDGSSCGVIVILMAKAVMNAYPDKPVMAFQTDTAEIAKKRETLAKEVLEASVFDMDNNCALCAMAKPPLPGPSITDWIQCDDCGRWFHAQCLQMDDAELAHVSKEYWKCSLCI